MHATSSRSKCVLDFDQERILLRGAALDDDAGNQMLRGADHARAGLDDASLLPRDFLDRMAQKIFVIEINLRDYRDFRQQNVRGIEAAAHADFAVTAKSDASFREILKRQGRDALKKRRVRGEESTGEQLLDHLVAGA